MKHLTPLQAHEFLRQSPAAVLLDIRFPEELAATGTPQRAVHLPFQSIRGDANPHFVHTVVARVPRSAHVLLICRSGKRTIDAGEVLESLGYRHVINVLHGVEGDADEHGVRGRINGWLKDGLPVRIYQATSVTLP
jgi:rhodanese-related sulfurtransferase